MAKRTGEYRAGDVFSIRLNAETAAELRWAVKESGTSASELFRRGLRPILAMIRADWYEKHGSEDDWEVVPDSGRPLPSRSLHSQFGVRVTGEQLHELAPAAEAFGVPISVFLREAALALAASMASGGTAQCAHVSMGHVTGGECGFCGPLPVTYSVTSPAPAG